MLTSTLIATAIMTGLGLFFGIGLAVAHRLLKVEEDPRLEIVEEKLPGSNCGACGEAGCRAFAEKLLAGAVAPSKCSVSNQEAIDDIANELYAHVDAKVPLNGLKLDLGAQYLRQDDVGDGPAGIPGPVAVRENFGSGELDYNLYGLKAGLLGPKKKWSVHAFWNHSDGDTAFLNSFGADPAYTSSIFSRNAYRENVDAWGLRGRYMIMPGLVFMAAYFDYGKSDTVGVVPGLTQRAVPTSNADELDLVLVWKPKQVKGLAFKTFYVNRTSEYDGFVNPRSGEKADATMSHWRLIATYQF